MKIFSSDKIREIDAYTIQNEPVKSVDLMERAAGSLFNWFINNTGRSDRIFVFTGPGNNGGDGLALSRMLADAGYRISVYHILFTSKTSEDWQINHERLIRQNKAEYNEIKAIEDFPVLNTGDIIIDCIFGSGLSRPVQGLPGAVIKKINGSDAKVVSVDIPSGLFGEDNTGNDPESIIHAGNTLTLQFPKLSFFFAENHQFVGDYHILPIGLHPNKINNLYTDYQVTDTGLVAGILKERSRFDHKGNFGHGLMIAGSCGKAGAAVLSSHAALRTGIGLLTVHVPRPVAGIIHCSLPEAMIQCDQSDLMVTSITVPEKYDALGIGPGLGTKPNTRKGVRELLEKYKGPLVIDADAINILSMDTDLVNLLPEDTVLTPHPGEFRRLAGPDTNGFERLQKQQEISKRYKCVIILKGAYSSVSLPDGRIWFNTSGNPGMATAGSGDVLTGMVLALLAQGYKPSEAAIAATFIHGLAGDIAAANSGLESLIASDIIYNIGNAFSKIKQYKNKLSR